MISRQAMWGYQRDLVRLRAIVDGAPVVVGFDPGTRQYYADVISGPPCTRVIVGRYQVVAAWLDGFAYGYRAAQK